VVIENVPGIFSSPESPLADFIKFLSDKGYFSIAKGVLKVCEHGVPQTRKRFVLIASRVKEVSLPKPIRDNSLTVRNFIGDETKFPSIPVKNKQATLI